ncbi:hypothetical protein RhiirA1_393824 [Rhizophagus irregularis]|uniref:Uncharacterized protein n=1 Tax=Rhizophagus irregularis TaxID=588596 RepID=A0A2N0RVD9_9GLOM|nr:hypothetical protein RhiirA1_393824 [Rhizophagus irregularis]
MDIGSKRSWSYATVFLHPKKTDRFKFNIKIIYYMKTGMRTGQSSGPVLKKMQDRGLVLQVLGPTGPGPSRTDVYLPYKNSVSLFAPPLADVVKLVICQLKSFHNKFCVLNGNGTETSR